ncbi:MAG TPA: hypothetical protein VFT46_00430 [Holophagaceae bacterium]|nr:hypothetical protein [Holophagaceae bacterium]
MIRRAPGLAVWAAALVAAGCLPGRLWREARPPAFPSRALAPTALALLLLAGATLLLVRLRGPRLAGGILAVLEAPPDLVWALLLLALWPAGAGPPGGGAGLLAFLLAALPGELRWLASTLPPERPFPEAWGPGAVRAARGRALRRLAPWWLAARLPVWLTASLVIERALGLPGLGSDWMARVALRDHRGLAAWIGALALLWLLARPLEGRAASP